MSKLQLEDLEEAIPDFLDVETDIEKDEDLDKRLLQMSATHDGQKYSFELVEPSNEEGDVDMKKLELQILLKEMVSQPVEEALEQ